VHSVATAAPSGLTVGGTQNAGTSTSLVRADHVHAMPALVTTTVDGFMSAADKTRLDGMATSAAAVGSTAASQVTVATAASGAATTAARSDHVHSVATAAPSALTVGAAQNAGTSTSLVRADHVHAMPAAGTPVALTLAGANAPGSAATLALSDHVHALPATAAPAALTVGAASSAGVAVTLPRSDHVHAMPALVTTSVDGFMLAADKSKLDGVEAGAQVTSFARVQTALAAASSAVSINAQRLTSVADPTAAQDAATKAYVDALAQGLDTKASCRLVSTTNMGTLGGAQVIDGIVTQTGDRLLIVGQTTASQNGIYIGSGITWLRAPDADTSAKVTSGMYVFVTEGTANADSGWALITPDPIVLGTTALTFTQVTGAGQITAGAGLTKSGNTLNVVAHADASIVVAADSVQVGLITDAQHGARAGGTTHAAAIAGGASGFMTGADKTKLDASASTAYVDALPIKQACRVVYTLNPAPVGLIVCDGITVSNGDRVLVIGQLSWQANGIYIAGAGAWVRAPDADTSAELPASMLVPVGPEGTTYPNTLWQMRAAAPVNLGTTTFLFTLVSGVLSSTTSPNVTAAAAAVGTGNTVARQDHTHQVTAGSPVALTLAATTADGTSNNLARADHVHALPATAAPAALTVGAASSAGVAVTLNRSDHVHAMPGAATTGAAGFMSAADKTRLDGMATGAAALASTAPLENTGAAAVGVATTAARGDHQHPSAWKAICVAVHESVGFDAAAPPATVDGITIVAGDYILVDGRGAPLAGEDPEPLTGELLGIFLSLGATWLFLETLDRGDVAYVKSTDSLWTYNGSQYVELYAQLSSATPTQVYDRAAHPGVTSTAARSDHVHNIATLAPSTLSVTGTNAIGTSQSLAKADHLHNIATAAPTALTVGGSVNAGSSASLARADHVHAMPNVATTGAAGFMSAADKARVDIGALPYSATVAANTWTVANSGGTKTLPSPAVVGDTVAILVTNASVNIAAGSGNTIIDATASGFSTLTSVPYPAQYTFRCAASGFWFLGDNLASPSSPALPGLMSAADKFKLDAIESGAQVTSFARVQTALNAASSAVGFNSQRIQNVAAPAAGNDVVTSTYLDTQLGTFYSTLARVNQCRLSGQAQNPVMTTDNAAISTLYLLPHTGDVIWLYSSTYSAWRPFRATTASAGIALTGLTAGRPYDVFAYATPGSGPGTVANIELLAWTSTSARATAIVDSGGVWVKSGDITRRYVGTILARTATTISWLRNGYTTTTAKCDIWNIDNRIDASFQWEPAWTGSFPTGTAGVWFLPTAGAKFEFISGLAFDFVNARFTAGVNTGGTGASGFVGISLNGAEQDHAARVITATGEVTPGTAEEFSLPAVGVNTLQYQLFGSTTAVVFYLTDDSGGAGGNPPLYKYGCVARHMY
jgi:hypothetical protein